MDVYAPNYYKDFKCIAQDCKHSCCIGWDIYVDEATLEKYKRLDTELGAELMRSITRDGDGAYIERRADGGCPMLTENGLCRLIIDEGEDHLCDICRLHPRFFNEIGERAEVGIGISCEAACSLVLLGREPMQLVKIGEKNGSARFEFDALADRDRALAIISRTDIDYYTKLAYIKEQYDVSTDFYTVTEWIDLFSELEILDEKWRELLTEAQNCKKPRVLEAEKPILERFLEYAVFRHVSAASNTEQLRARVGFALVSAEMFEIICSGQPSLSIDDMLDIARMYSSEIEYSEDNTATLIFEFECHI